MKDKSDGAIWKSTSSYGEYLSGNIVIGGTSFKFNAYPNKYKKQGDRSPDYRVVLKKDVPKPAKYEEDIPY